MLKTCKILEEGEGTSIASFQITNLDELNIFFKFLKKQAKTFNLNK